MVTRFTGILSPTRIFALKGGFGFVILKNNEVIAGISSGLVYREAVEVEVATRPNEQGNGFAKSLVLQ